MKRLGLIIIAFLLLAGCTPEEAVDGKNSETATPDSGETYEIGEPSTEQNAGSETSTTETPSSMGEERFVITNISSSPLQTELMKSVTIREKYDEVDGAVHTTFKNHDLDFSELIITVDALVCKESGTSIDLTVTFPEEWTNAEIHSMSLYLGFRASTDQKEITDFRMLSQNPLPSMSHTEERLDSIEYSFYSPMLTPTKLSGNESLYLTPIVQYREILSGSRTNGRAGDRIMLLEGDSCTYDGTEWYYAGSYHYYSLDELKLGIPLPEWVAAAEAVQPSQNEEEILTVTHWEEDWERNEELDYYDNYSPFLYGTAYNTSADFSEVELVLYSATVWDGGIQFVLRVTLPASWDQETVNAVRRGAEVDSGFSTLVETDDVDEETVSLPETQDPDRKLWSTSSYISGTVTASYLNQTPDYPREYYVICESPINSFWILEHTQTVGFVLRYRYATALEMGDKVFDLTSGERVNINAFITPETVQQNLREITVLPSEIFGYEEILG
ncbi:MAG: hypothetical protein Q4C01_06920 [Clostridia bacterium]|nr:hypothetical protein [Clostridia bacterium]